jgi:hypothetical protein
MALTAAQQKALAQAEALKAKLEAQLAAAEQQQAAIKAQQEADKQAAIKQAAADRLERIRNERIATQSGTNPDNPMPSTAPAAGMKWANYGGVWKEYALQPGDPGYVAPAAAGGGSSGGGNTDNTAMVDALNRQAAATAAATKAAADEKAAAIMSQKVKAADAMSATFKQYGLESLGSFISGQIMADTSPEALLIKLYDQPEYQARFPGMAALQKKNRTITEAEYIKLENSYAETLRFFDLPKGFMDDRATFGKMIASEVSPKELQDRAQIAQDLAKTTNPAIRKALTDFYGVGEGGITAYVLDADKALPLIQKQAKTATIAGVGSAAGFSLGNTESELMAAKGVYQAMNETDMTKAFGAAAQLRDAQQRLAYLDRTTYDKQEALAAGIEGDQGAILASQKRAQREVARFSGGSGVSAQSLRSNTTSNI